MIIDLIAATTTRTGLKVFARLDERAYPDKIKVPDAALAASPSPAISSTQNGTTPSTRDLLNDEP